MSLDATDIKIIREEGTEIKNKLDLIRGELKETNSLLRQLLSEMIKINAKDLPWTTIEK